MISLLPIYIWWVVLFFYISILDIYCFYLPSTLLSSLGNNSDSLFLPFGGCCSFTLWISDRPLVIVPCPSCLGLSLRSGKAKHYTSLVHDRQHLFPRLFRTRVERMALFFPCIVTYMYMTLVLLVVMPPTMKSNLREKGQDERQRDREKHGDCNSLSCPRGRPLDRYSRVTSLLSK